MQLKNDELRYGAVAQFFHWTIVVLIIVQFTLANQADNLPLGAAKVAVLARHNSFGITILALVLFSYRAKRQLELGWAAKKAG